MDRVLCLSIYSCPVVHKPVSKTKTDPTKGSSPKQHRLVQMGFYSCECIVNLQTTLELPRQKSLGNFLCFAIIGAVYKVPAGMTIIF